MYIIRFTPGNETVAYSRKISLELNLVNYKVCTVSDYIHKVLPLCTCVLLLGSRSISILDFLPFA